jgi:hypothetical protein
MAALGSQRDPMESLRYTLRRWYSMVFGLRNKAAAVSLIVRPSARLRIRDVVTQAGLTRFRRVGETLINAVFEARP